MKVILHPMADTEFADAITFYESKQSGVGERFYRETYSVLNWIAANPATPRLRNNYRWVNLSVFPYYIVYITYPDLVWVVAVAHGHRKPDYWINRIGG